MKRMTIILVIFKFIFAINQLQLAKLINGESPLPVNHAMNKMLNPGRDQVPTNNI